MKDVTKKRVYNNLSKTVLILLMQLCTIVFALSSAAMLVFYVTQNNDIINSFGAERKFSDSDYFNNLLIKESHEVVNYIKDKSIFEIDGVYNGKKIINIRQYLEMSVDKNIPEEAELNYYLEDLIKWSQSGWSYTEIPEDAVPHYNSPEDKTAMLEEVYSILMSTDAAATSQPIGFATNLYLQEEYMPVNGKPLLSYFGKVSLHTLYSEVEEVLDVISNQFQDYKKYSNQFKAENSNLRFIITDYEKEKTYTNLSDENTKKPSLDDLKKLGRYINIDSKSQNYESNTTIKESELYEMLSDYTYAFAGDYSIAIAVDTGFPISDEFSEKKEPYDKLIPWIQFLIIAIIVTTILSLILLIMLTCVTGRACEDNLIHLNWFDRIKTEIAAVLMIGVGAFILLTSVLFGQTVSRNTNWGITYTVLGIFAFVAMSFFLIGYLSLVRRIKSGTLWNNSICYWCIKVIRDFVSSAKSSVKVIIAFALFMIINWICIRMGGFGYIIAWILSVFVCLKLVESTSTRKKIIAGIKNIAGGDLAYKINMDGMQGDSLEMAESVNQIGEGLHNAIETSVKNERLKSDLITNVSHDIKTPLTSIINYVALLKREDIKDEKLKGYIEVLDAKSQRLKHLTEDLVEVSRLSSGNIVLNMENINFVELIYQTAGEFSEKFAARQLELIMKVPEEPVVIHADSRRIWRVIENLYNNVAKYAMESTRVYADLVLYDDIAEFSLKNMSSRQLNIPPEELTERFIRGDVSRSTEGSGLGLSIAKSLAEAQGGQFEIYLDGDLFKVILSFQKVEK